MGAAAVVVVGLGNHDCMAAELANTQGARWPITAQARDPNLGRWKLERNIQASHSDRHKAKIAKALRDTAIVRRHGHAVWAALAGHH